MRSLLSSAFAVVFLFSTLMSSPFLDGDDPDGANPSRSEEVHMKQFSPRNLIVSISEIADEQVIGDMHPDLFGDSFRNSSKLWDSPIKSVYLFETTRSFLRDRLLNDLDFGCGGCWKGVSDTREDFLRSRRFSPLFPVPLGGIDLGLIDPMFDAPLIPPARVFPSATPEAIWRQKVHEIRHQIVAWPRWEFTNEADPVTYAGIRASLGWDIFSPLSYQFVTLQLTANLETGGEKGCLLQICWQGSSRSP
ncbi:MAG: hypothetical protein AAEJ04_07645 [Planctomycetota bacterium]